MMPVSAAAVKELRDKSGAGMMLCKKALTEATATWRRRLSGFARRACRRRTRRRVRVAAEGAIHSYIHGGSRLGVLVEVNCETDFVARGDKFKELVADIAMQSRRLQPRSRTSPRGRRPRHDRRREGAP